MAITNISHIEARYRIEEEILDIIEAENSILDKLWEDMTMPHKKGQPGYKARKGHPKGSK